MSTRFHYQGGLKTNHTVNPEEVTLPLGSKVGHHRAVTLDGFGAHPTSDWQAQGFLLSKSSTNEPSSKATSSCRNRAHPGVKGRNTGMTTGMARDGRRGSRLRERLRNTQEHQPETAIKMPEVRGATSEEMSRMEGGKHENSMVSGTIVSAFIG